MAREELIIKPPPEAVRPALTVASISPLGADARHQQRHLADELAHPRDLLRESRTNDQRALPGGVPLARHQPRHPLKQFLATAHVEKLQVAAAGVGGAAQQDHPLSGYASQGSTESRPM